MKINWKVRAKNPVFWVQVAVAIILPLIVGVGMQWTDMTSWGILGRTLLKAIENPVVVVSMLISLWNAVNDPTTAGLKDSKLAMTYEEPKKSE